MDAGTGPEGQLKVAFVAGVTPGKWFRRWEERQPGIPLSSFECDAAAQVQVLRDGRADVGFVRLPMDSEGLSVIPLYEEQPVAVASRDHELKVFDEVSLTDLSEENLLDDGGDVAAALDLVAAGVGLLILPMAVARHHNRKDVLYRPVTGVEPTRVAVAWLSDRTNPLIEEFIGIVRGRTANSSRQPSAQEAKPKPAKKPRPAAQQGRPRKPAGKQQGKQAGRKPGRRR